MNWDVLKWEEVQTLGENALFIGRNASLSFSAADFVGCRPNCIYFTNNFSGKHDLGIFSLSDWSIEPLPCYPQNLYYHFGCPIWVTPNPWWPENLNDVSLASWYLFICILLLWYGFLPLRVKNYSRWCTLHYMESWKSQDVLIYLYDKTNGEIQMQFLLFMIYLACILIKTLLDTISHS